MKNPIQTFEPNEHGRDFVIGDLHGSLSSFQNLLKNLNFDETKDRMFSVGDLIDRGPDSPGCLELLHKPWFHSVLSNHEQMMLEAFDGGPMGRYWLQNGGSWGTAAQHDWVDSKRSVSNELDRNTPHPDSVKVFDALPVLRELPYIITVKMKDNKKFHIIHAELPPEQVLTDATLADPATVMEYAKIETREGEFFLWGRHMFRMFYGIDLTKVAKLKRTVAYKYSENFGWFNDELSHIISGHTIMQRPITIIGQTNIDTGAHGSYSRDACVYEALTCIELQTWKFYQATETTFRTVNPITINKDEVQKLRFIP
jgi:serine/threonine protein phosphatase 1